MKIVDKLRKIVLGGRAETVEDLRRRGVKVGENVALYSSDIDGGYGFLIEIGNNVTITNATILAHDASTKRFLGYTKVGRVKIGNSVFVGYGSIVLPGVTIGNNVIIGSGSVVRDNVPDNCVVVGNPAKIVCSTDDYLEKNRKRLENAPVYETYWKDKSEKEKLKMKNELDGKMGFNI